jgi:hypothetical protein
LNILVQHPGRQFKAIEGRRTPFTTTRRDVFDTGGRGKWNGGGDGILSILVI